MGKAGPRPELAAAAEAALELGAERFDSATADGGANHSIAS